MLKNKGITLIALVISIIILLILAGVAINFGITNFGITDKARWAAFVQEMAQVQENVDIEITQNEMSKYTDEVYQPVFQNKLEENKCEDSLVKEILFIRDGMPSNKELDDYQVPENKQTILENVWYIPKKLGNNKDKTYVYDDISKTVFKIEGISIWNKIIHSTKTGGSSSSNSTKEPTIATVESEIIEINGLAYYSPNFKGFNLEKTYVIFYSDSFEKYEMKLKEYIELGQPNEYTSSNGTKYKSYDYKDKIWANVKTISNELECYWVWIPRYEYSIIEENKQVDIVFTDINNNVLKGNKKQENKDYNQHSAFSVEGKEQLKGIWMSKYNATYKQAKSSEICYAPNFDGFDEEFTKIVYYADDFSTYEISLKEYNKLGKPIEINQSNKNYIFYNYKDKKWANIKTIANGLENEWVWIPRYAYNISTDLYSIEQDATVDVIFIDTSNKPMDTEKYGLTLSNDFTVHPAFNVEGKEPLKGIWMSKYNATYKKEVASSDVCYEPNMVGYNVNNTYIITYNSTGTEKKGQYKLKDVLSENSMTDEKTGILISGQVDKSKFEKSDEIWYDYSNKIWANIKAVNGELETQWVWIPRYAYNISADIYNIEQDATTDVIFIDINNLPYDKETYGKQLKENMTVHSAFDIKALEGEEGNNIVTLSDGTRIKKLKGIWMSKYNATEKN